VKCSIDHRKQMRVRGFTPGFDIHNIKQVIVSMRRELVSNEYGR